MLTRFTLATCLAVTISGLAPAQQLSSKLRPVTGSVKNAGTYHLATSTWTRGAASVATAGPEVIYDNTCTVGYYFAMDEGMVVNTYGRVPSRSSPSNPNSVTGTADRYEVNGFEIGYCSFEPFVTSLDISFADCYQGCNFVGPAFAIDPLTTFHLVNVPAGSVAGSISSCWVIAIDLTNTSAVFGLNGDCDGVYDDYGDTDQFGWSWTQSIPTTTSDSGPLLAGDPAVYFNSSCGSVGGGTTFVGATPGPGTGLDLGQSMFIEQPSGPEGCYWFGSYSPVNPAAAFYMKLRGTLAIVDASWSAYCFGDGTGANCPCSALGAPGEGCANTTGGGAVLSSTGAASLSNDTLQLDVSGAPDSKPGLLLKGNNQIAVPAGDGILCTAGGSQRSQVQITAAGATSYSTFNGLPLGSVANVGGTTNFQFWYRDTQNTCSGAGFNFTNGVTGIYLP